jgi:diguanylate cyclase (GGDEF)-like protein/PAS domain S-box-containing protein
VTDQTPIQPDDVVVELAAHHRSLQDDNVVLLLPGVDGAGTGTETPLVVRLREALDASNEMILVVEPAGRVLFANRTARSQLSLDDEDPTFRAVESLLTGTRRDDVWQAIEHDQEWRGDLSATRSDGSTVHLELTLLADGGASGDIRSLTVVAHDVGEKRALEDALAHRTTHDGLTGLANRQHLLSQLNDALPELNERNQSGALLLVDIDEFRTVTNSLGHEAGDRVLVAFAYRLLRTFPSNALLARVGGDEFAVFCPGVHDVDALADQTDRTTAAPFYIDGTEVHLSVVAGIAITTPDNPAASGEALLREADAASYRAKERGRGSVEIFEPQLQTDAVDRLSVVQDLRRALRNDELRVHYQPKISLETGAIIGAEALMRWQAPDGTLRGPGAFMDIAEDTGLIIPMGRWILQEVCEAAVELQPAMPNGAPLELSVNMSVRQLDHPSCAGDVEEAIDSSGVDPGLIELEVTESALMEDVEASAALLNQLKALGVRIAVDDFGTGYSSLRYLQRLPVDVLKVDQTFVAGLDDQEGDRVIVEAVVQLAQALRLTSVAEGVETPHQLEQLRAMGCVQAQGFHIARPMPIDELRDLIRTSPTW